MSAHPETPPAPPPSRVKSDGICLFVGLVVVGGIFLVVPLTAHSGPTREGECHMAQAGLEGIAARMSDWEKKHSDRQPLDLAAIQKGMESGESADPGCQAFLEGGAERQPPEWEPFGLHLLRASRGSQWRREAGGAGQAVRLAATFRYSRGSGDPPFELHSWDRAPVEAYMGFAWRQKIWKVVTRLGPPLLLWALCSAGIAAAVVALRTRKAKG